MALMQFTAGAAFAQAAEPVPSVVMTGEAEQTGAPDIVFLTLGVTKDGQTASQALRASTEATRSVLDVVRKYGLESRDIQTSGLSIQPRYGRPPQRSSSDERSVVVGYTASNQISLRLRTIERVGEFLDAVVAAGSNEIRGIRFDIADRAKLLDSARKLAVDDAKRKAMLYADAAGIRLGAIISLEEEGTGQPQPRMFAARAATMEAAAAPVPVEAGEIAIHASVRITWRIAN
jgi:uncharacterized protein YggE